MADASLKDCRILVVEDEYMLAEELKDELTRVGAIVLGPVGDLERALHVARTEDDIDGAILDLNLRGEMTFPLADALIERNIPIVFATGYDRSAIPPRFTDVVRCEKPINVRLIPKAIGRAVHPEAALD